MNIDVLREIFNHPLLNINKIFIFGSTACGDNDSLSDFDVLLLTDSKPDRVRKFLIFNYGMRSSEEIIVLTTEKYMRMIHSGAEFAWTIYLCGKILFSRENIYCLIKPAETNVPFRLQAQLDKTDEINQEINSVNFLNGYETINIYSAIRCAIFCRASTFNTPSIFMKMAPVDLDPSFPLDKETFTRLMQTARSRKNGLHIEKFSINELSEINSQIRSWIAYLLSETPHKKVVPEDVILLNKRAKATRVLQRKLLKFYRELCPNIEEPASTGTQAIHNWCTQARQAGYEWQSDMLKFSLGEWVLQKKFCEEHLQDIPLTQEQRIYADQLKNIINSFCI